MTTLNIPSSDIIRLILHHLTECGLHESARTLRKESGIGMICMTSTPSIATENDIENSKTTLHVTGNHMLANLCKNGDWGVLLEHLQMLDPSLIRNSGNNGSGNVSEVLRDVHEMSILELAAMGDVMSIDLAQAALRLCSTNLQGENSKSIIDEETRVSIESKLKSLTNLLRNNRNDANENNFLPNDYYGPDNMTCELRRKELAAAIQKLNIPASSTGRLVTLLQQAIKWQSYTDQLSLKTSSDLSSTETEDYDGSDSKRKKQKQSKEIMYDLLLGAPRNILPSKTELSVDKTSTSKSCTGRIKLGTKTEAKSALFLAEGKNFVTGSSDGFIEIWDSERCKLDTIDYKYQGDDDLMLHDSAVLALAVSRDGEMVASGSADGNVRIWKIGTGKCLRDIKNAHSDAITCLSFTKSGSQILTGSQDGLCREFGLRASKLLKEYRGHTSFVTSCHYVDDDKKIVTASADGSFRVWDRVTTEMKHKLYPNALESNFVSNYSEAEHHSILYMQPLHSPKDTFIIVPRGSTAYLVNETGKVLQRYDLPSTKNEIIAAIVSPSNQYLFCVTDEQACVCFDVVRSRLLSLLQLETNNKKADEIILAHHPHKNMLATCNTEYNEKGKKRGIIRFWS